ncbi:MAG: hypothetical protein HY718_10150 [Planctomycetes bacterium]|nr:hypothetical protein [Planctomycetota bacterium]
MADQPPSPMSVEHPPGASASNDAGSLASRSRPAAGARFAALAAVVVVLGLTLVQLYRANRLCHGEFTYSTDAAYQHLTAARQLVDAGPQAWSGDASFARTMSASAAWGWTILLAGLMRLPWLSAEAAVGGGGAAMLPAAANMAFAAALLLIAGHLLRRECSAGAMFGGLVLLSVLTPAPALVLAGTEWPARAVFVLLAAAACIGLIERDDAGVGSVAKATLAVALMMLMGHEGLIVLLAIALWAIGQRRLRRMWLPLATATLLVGVMGVVVFKGGGWIAPNAWAIWWADTKAQLGREGIGYFYSGFLGSLATVVSLFALVAVALLWMRRADAASTKADDRERAAWLFVYIVTALVHVALVRGEPLAASAWLMPMGFVAVGRGMARGAASPTESRKGLVLVVLACLVPIVLIAMPSLRLTIDAPDRCADAWKTDRAVASFVRTFFPNGPVAATRCGLLTFDTNARVVDLRGLHDPQVALARVRGDYTVDYVTQRTTGAGVQIVLEDSDRVLPVGGVAAWRSIGGWCTPSDHWRIQLWAANPGMDQDARIALRLAAERAPAGVEHWFAGHAGGPPETASGPG